MSKRINFGKILSYVIVIFASVVSLAPLLWILSLSFKKQAEWNSYPPTLIPKSPTLVNYVNAFLNSPVPRFFLNSTVVAFVSLGISLLLGSLAAYVIAKKNFPLKNVVFFSIISVRMIPALLSIIPLYVIMYKLGWLDSYMALIAAYSATGIPVVTWIMRGFFEGIPKELEEAAILDGCTQLQAFFKVIVPLAMPGVSASAIFVFVRLWNEYIIALTLTSSNEMRTLPVGIRNALGSRMADLGSMSAYSMIAMVPIIAVFLIFQKKFISGLTNGAIK